MTASPLMNCHKQVKRKTTQITCAAKRNNDYLETRREDKAKDEKWNTVEREIKRAENYIYIYIYMYIQILMSMRREKVPAMTT